jgi:adenylate cyclase class IV
MAQESYEIEIKSLLGAQEKADELRSKLKQMPGYACGTSYTQLNHYFEGGNPHILTERVGTKLTASEREQMEKIASAEKISVRTREMNGIAKIVMKASIGSDSSANGVMRLELEAAVPDASLDDLDKEVLAAGYTYQAKWSRMREDHKVGPISICLDKNAGYGWLAEFEKVVDTAAEAVGARSDLADFMQKVGAAELPQDRLERMFSYYNLHWPEYYGTDKIFIIE